MSVIKEVRKNIITYEPKADWDFVDEKIQQSKIKRYPWKDIFGTSLTQEILRLKKEGCDSEQVFQIIYRDITFQKFLLNNPTERTKILENIRTSIHARFAENNTAEKIRMER